MDNDYDIEQLSPDEIQWRNDINYYETQIQQLKNEKKELLDICNKLGNERDKLKLVIRELEIQLKSTKEYFWKLIREKGITENKIWDEILKFNIEYFPKWQDTELIYWSNALAGEVGEFCNLVKKSYGGGTRVLSLTDTELMDKCFNEIADITIYLILTVNGKLGLSYHDYEKIVLDKIQKNRERMKNNIKSIQPDNLHYKTNWGRYPDYTPLEIPDSLKDICKKEDKP